MHTRPKFTRCAGDPSGKVGDPANALPYAQRVNELSPEIQ
jgi:hypothetical protein